MSAPPKEEAILRDAPDPTALLLGRLDSWIHAVGLFEDYIEAHIQIQKSTTAGLEKVRKVNADAPKFDFQSGMARANSLHAVTSGPSSPTVETATPVGGLEGPDGTTIPADAPLGIAESFEQIRIRTDALINKSVETEQALRTSVLPQLATTRADIEKHVKGLKTSGVKQSKEVEKAKSVTLQAVEELGRHTSSFNISAGGNRHDYKHDPYVLYRQTLNAIDDQLAKENSQIDALVFTEKSIETLENHVVQTLQQAAHLFDQITGAYNGLALESSQIEAQAFASIEPGSEWNLFFANNGPQLVPYDKPHREISHVTFHNDGHPSTRPVLEGVLLRKEGKLLKSWTSGYYVLTPSNYLLQYTSNNYVQDPTPEFALYLPEATVSEIITKEGGKFKFTVTAKDGTRTVGLGSKTYSFKTNTYEEIGEWQAGIKAASTGIKNVLATGAGAAVPAVEIPPAGSELSYTDPNLTVEQREAAHLAESLQNTNLNK
ncbi:uncharacterized protein SAPINGB_P004242 [Magnusiomyces paraingens]|uniref:PH domain-containing protein n=1 Tax=Magnusiomyces paraingens TaxID=2606893 RepID=A0A5E8BTE0_9ASCO|nr:uncharacterized protein SAPINGB_P004242 [Saprochaete ingens]VVT54756.1 unnamed protein product [Saprochaete ingens]